MQPIDTHCHIHDQEFFDAIKAEEIFQVSATELEHMLLIGTSLLDSRRAVDFASAHMDKSKAAVGIHPHEALKMGSDQIKVDTSELKKLAQNDHVRAIGECGLDFYYNDRSKALALQTQLLEAQLQIATDLRLPVSFHVREAFDDFWPVFDNFSGITGVLHSFTDRQKHVDVALSKELLVGINGIATFTSHSWQRQIFASIPLESVVLETDSPFLTPRPMRGTINEPRNVTYVTKFLAELRGDNAEHITQITTNNARRLFRL